MITEKLHNMIGGWLIGNFCPSIYKTKEFEVGIKTYKKNQFEAKHHHKIATEVTAIISGSAKFNNHILHEGEVIKIEPGESIKFIPLTDCVTLVVKWPSVKGDKYLDE